MIISTLNESPKDARVAITPNAIKLYKKLNLTVCCEQNAGLAAGFTDSDYQALGADIIANRQELLANTDLLVCLNEPDPNQLTGLKSGALIITPIEHKADNVLVLWCCQQNISLFAMNLIPRISRAQGMDSLSSQANLVGYRAIIEGAYYFNRAIPMMMTAAGMIHPANVLVLGAGVAGLQAIATAKRLGAVVYAFDVRRAAKEQVESLGAKFIEVESHTDNETTGGYASEMSDKYKQLQAELIHHYALLADMVIATALIPAKKAPLLITTKTVDAMKSGSVIVDCATAQGGNCELSQQDKVIKHQQVTIVGFSHLAGHVATTASELYSGNLLNLLRFLAPNDNTIQFNETDEIIKQAMLCYKGQYLPFQSTKETMP